jgi:uncharacterized protein (DUF2141 family)
MLRFLLFLWLPFGAMAQNSSIQIDISNFRNDDGKLIFALFNASDGFPRSATKAFKRGKQTIQQGKTTIYFPNMPKGDYSIAVLHDENDNGHEDNNFFGLPKEGFGFSVKQAPIFKAPSFEETKFAHGDKNTTVRFKIIYLSF